MPRANRDYGRRLRMLVSLERALRGPMRKELASRANAAAEAYKTKGAGGIDLALLGHMSKVDTLISTQYRVAGSVFGKEQLDSLKGLGAWEHKDYSDELFNQLMDEFITSFGTKKIAEDISLKTRSLIMDAIREGQNEGLGTSAVAKLIRQKAGGLFAARRSHIIARTETHNAAGFAQNSAAQASGVGGLMKTWESAADDRTRDAHMEASGQTVPMDTPFVLDDPRIGTYTLMFPGDRHGPPAGTIMCRCFNVYAPAEDS